MSSALAAQNPRTLVSVTPSTALSHPAVCVYVCLDVRVFSKTHTLDYTLLLILSCLCVCCSAVKTCLAGLCVAIENKKRETELLSAFLCFTASLHCCCAALCSCVLPRLPSPLCVLLICPSVHCKAAVRHCVSVLCAAVRLPSQILFSILLVFISALCCCVCVLQ